MKKSMVRAFCYKILRILNKYKLFVFIYLICTVCITGLVIKSGYKSEHKFYDSVKFESDTVNYNSEKMTVPAGVFNTSIVYSCEADCIVEISADNEVIAQGMATQTPKGEYNVLTILNGTVKSTSNYVISFINANDMSISVISVEFASTVQMNKDHRARAVVCFLMMISGFIFIICIAEGVITKMQAIVVSLLSVFVLYVSTPLAADAVFASHDLWGLCGRIEGIKDALNDGQLFPVVLPNSNNGYGYLGFMYPELFLFIPALLRKADVTMMTAYQIYLFIINIATAVVAYVSVRSVLEDLSNRSSDDNTDINKVRVSSMVCSIFYLLANYRLTDIYIRAAVGEAVAMMFLPLVIAGMYQILMGNRKKWLMLVIGMTGLLHSHILSCAMIIPMLIIIVVPNIVKIIREKRYVELFYSIGAFFLINVWYIIPFIKFFLFGLNTDALVIEYIEEHTVPIRQIFALNVNDGSRDDIFLSIGVSSLIAIILTCIYYVEKIADRNSDTSGKIRTTDYVLMNIMTFCSITHLMMAVDLFPWKWLEDNSNLLRSVFSMLQFPFRLLTIVTACLVFMLAICILKVKSVENYLVTICAVIIVFSVINSNSLMDRYVTGNKDIVECTGGFADHTPADYLPAGTDETVFFDKEAYIDNGTIEYVKDGTQITMYYTSNENTNATIPMLYYPCYKAKDESGNKIDLFKADNNRIGLNLPAGSHVVSVWLSLL